jgi:HD superfamily phosphohydrolase
MQQGKIINDPVYGFIQFQHPLLLQIIEHSWFQRLRYIKQMGMAPIVYPGAIHTRFQHSLGACHLITKALSVLRSKDIAITEDEFVGTQIAILLHDIGHGPFSHALEFTLLDGITHEQLSIQIMEAFNRQWHGQLDTAIAIYSNTYPKQFLHQLVSSQLDVDRLDYLNRDSFFSGVSEGVIGYDRILHMLNVVDDKIVVEEKGIHSIEKFIVARRLMYWQVYLHKTVLGAEKLLINILKRAKELAKNKVELFASPSLSTLLYHNKDNNKVVSLELFCSLDDTDIQSAIKVWQSHNDEVLSRLCNMLLQRKLYKVQLLSLSESNTIDQYKERFLAAHPSLANHIDYFVFEGLTSNNTYDATDENILILQKNGLVQDLSSVEHALINDTLSKPITKRYLCYTLP